MGKQTLMTLKVGEQGKVAKLKGDKLLKRKLSEMGFVKGVTVTANRTAPLGDPRAYTLHGGYITLGNDEARHIIIK